MEAGSAARSFKGSDCCARRARRGAGGGCVRAELCAQSVRAGADRSEQRAALQQAAGRHDALDPAGRDAADRRGAGETGFDSTGSIAKKRKAKRKPGSPYPMPRAGAVVLHGAPQQATGQTAAPQIAARAAYANVYKPPDAPRAPSAAAQHRSVRAGRRARRQLPAAAVDRGRLRRRQQSEPHARRAALELHAGAAGAAGQVGMVAPRARRDAARQLLSPTTRCRRPTGRPPTPRCSAATTSTRDLRFEGEGRFLLGTDNPGSPNLQAGLAQAADLHHLGRHRRRGAALQPSRSVGEGQRRPHHVPGFRADRRHHASATQDRNYYQYRVQARASYEFTPGFKPFVEIGRRQAQARRAMHLRRHRPQIRTRFTPKAGVTFELVRYLTGEVSVGYTTREYVRPGPCSAARLGDRCLAGLGRDRADHGDADRQLTRRGNRRSPACPARCGATSACRSITRSAAG